MASVQASFGALDQNRRIQTRLVRVCAVETGEPASAEETLAQIMPGLSKQIAASVFSLLFAHGEITLNPSFLIVIVRYLCEPHVCFLPDSPCFQVKIYTCFDDPDAANPRSIPEAALLRWSSEPGITWHGRVTDVAQVWREHHIAMLLSYYREGLPRTLVEAAAAGGPIVTTDVWGCREIVRDGTEGFLVPPRDDAAARALMLFAGDPDLRSRMGRRLTRAFASGSRSRPSSRRSEAFIGHCGRRTGGRLITLIRDSVPRLSSLCAPAEGN